MPELFPEEAFDDLWLMHQEEKEFMEFIEMMEHRSNIAKETPCPHCGYKTLTPISLSESKCETCNNITEI